MPKVIFYYGNFKKCFHSNNQVCFAKKNNGSLFCPARRVKQVFPTF
jgi:hypothetical protein